MQSFSGRAFARGGSFVWFGFFGGVAVLNWFCFGFFETGAHYIALFGLELPK